MLFEIAVAIVFGAAIPAALYWLIMVLFHIWKYGGGLW